MLGVSEAEAFAWLAITVPTVADGSETTMELAGREFGLQLFPGDALVAGLTKSLVHFDEIESILNHVHELLAGSSCLEVSVWRKPVIEQGVNPPQQLPQLIHYFAKLGSSDCDQPPPSVTL